MKALPRMSLDMLCSLEQSYTERRRGQEGSQKNKRRIRMRWKEGGEKKSGEHAALLRGQAGEEGVTMGANLGKHLGTFRGPDQQRVRDPCSSFLAPGRGVNTPSNLLCSSCGAGNLWFFFCRLGTEPEPYAYDSAISVSKLGIFYCMFHLSPRSQ